MSMRHEPSDQPTYETRDVAFRPIVGASLGLVALVVATFAGMWALERALRTREAERSPAPSPLAASYGRREPPAPRLQDAPAKDLAALRARENTLLDGYAWIDRRAGRVRIPLARARELLTEADR